MLDVRTNFKNKYLYKGESLQCQLCDDGQLETQSHIAECKALGNNVDIVYNDLFSPNLDIVKDNITKFEVAWSERCEKLQSMQD